MLQHKSPTLSRNTQRIATRIMRPYSFIEPEDTPALNEPITPADDKENIYGKVIFQRGELRVRVNDDLYSVWMGKRLEITIADVDLAEKVLGRLG